MKRGFTLLLAAVMLAGCIGMQANAAALQATGEKPSAEYLIPSGDYGEIYPYPGDAEPDSFQKLGSCYGFFNLEGQAITKPSYTDIYRLPVGDNLDADYFWEMHFCDEAGRELVTFASADGSRVCPKAYNEVLSLRDYIVGFRGETRSEFDVYDRDFALCMTEKDFQVQGHQTYPFANYKDQFACQYVDRDGCCLMQRGGHILQDDLSELMIERANRRSGRPEGEIRMRYSDGLCSSFSPDGTLLTCEGEDLFLEIKRISGQLLFVQMRDGRRRIIRSDGSVLADRLKEMPKIENCGFAVDEIEDGKKLIQYYDLSGNLLFSGSRAENTGWIYLGFGRLFYRDSADSFEIWDADQPESVVTEAAGPKWVHVSRDLDGAAITYTKAGSSEQMAVYYAPGSPAVTWQNVRLVDLDAGYLLQLPDPEKGGLTPVTEIRTGKTIWCSGTIACLDGFVETISAQCFTVYGKDGAVLFCYPFG